MKQLKRIFYIYSEATAAALMAAGALIELMCWAYLPAPISWLAASATLFFMFAFAGFILHIYRAEK